MSDKRRMHELPKDLSEKLGTAVRAINATAAEGNKLSIKSALADAAEGWLKKNAKQIRIGLQVLGRSFHTAASTDKHTS